jgi:large subunit ribosomal protein L1
MLSSLKIAFSKPIPIPIKSNLITLIPVRSFASILSIERMKEKRKKKDEENKMTQNLKSQSQEKSSPKTASFAEKLDNLTNISTNLSTNASITAPAPEIPLRKRIFANPQQAIIEIKKIKQKFPNQTLDMVVGLNIDPKRGDQVVRGIYRMPGGSNKIPKVMVFTSPACHEIAKNAGADFIADQQTYKNISEGIIDFEKTVCTLDTLPALKNLGRILGPKGLMPSVKVGTACTVDNLDKIIRDLKMGSREFKTDVWGQIQVPVGRLDFTEDKILQNIDSFMKSVLEKKPEVIKGRYFLYATLYTYRHSFRLDMRSMDPKSSTYFYENK